MSMPKRKLTAAATVAVVPIALLLLWKINRKTDGTQDTQDTNDERTIIKTPAREEVGRQA
jgi:hypothetical protein